MIEVRVREIDGRVVCGPMVVCDECGEPINRASDGTYEYPVVDERCHGELYFAHKECSGALQGERRGGREWMSTDLDLFPLFVADAMHVDLHELEEKGQHLGEAGFAY